MEVTQEFTDSGSFSVQGDNFYSTASFLIVNMQTWGLQGTRDERALNVLTGPFRSVCSILQTNTEGQPDRVTQINIALSAFYRFIFHNKQRTEYCCFPALGIPLRLWSAGQWGNCLISPWVGWSFCQRGRSYNSKHCDRTTAGAFFPALVKAPENKKA